jgi:hypothetical protein
MGFPDHVTNPSGETPVPALSAARTNTREDPSLTEARQDIAPTSERVVSYSIHVPYQLSTRM